MQDPRVLDTAELEPGLANLRKARDAGFDEGADSADYREIDRVISAFEEEIRRRSTAD
ncbi:MULTISPECIES: hypothetical protein [Antrihabitans]|uniref:Uncharacterized protein n=2 Tax=Antrihabitans TaxID=2799491 RepID=A0A934NUR3_9NOCA|nr:hypothetical protein [Antrihabitans stalagmiti]MBJ8341652.1 hypothetical protein [Antrihabitans stalagmiti]